MPRALRNRGNFVISLGDLCQWLASQAEALGCHVLPGFAAADVLYDGERVAGVVTGDLGVARDGSHKTSYQPGYELRAKYTVFAEGCRGHLGRRLEARFGLRADADPQHYGIGFKEIWQIDAAKHRPGEIVHTLGWPLDAATDGGGFVYHAADARVYVGFIVGLGLPQPASRSVRRVPTLEAASANPRAARGRRAHRVRRACRQQGRIAVVAEAVVSRRRARRLRGRFPESREDQGLAHGDEDAGCSRRKRSSPRSRSKARAADAELARYDERVRASWVWDELHRGRNFSAGIAKLGTLLGGALAFVEQNLLRRPSAVDAAQSQRGSRAVARRGDVAATAVSETGRRRVVRSRELGVLVEHGARREPAVPSEARGSGGADRA